VWWRDRQTLVLDFDYPADGPLADFHAGALEALFARLVPGLPVDVTREQARASFRVRFDRVLEPHAPLDADLLLELRGEAGDGRIASALPATVAELVARAVQERWVPASIDQTAAAITSEIEAMAEAGSFKVRLSHPLSQAFCGPNIAGIADALAAGAPSETATDRIVAYLRTSGVLDPADGADDALLSSGRLDSFGLAALLTFVEDAFDTAIEIDEVTAADFDCASAIAAYIERRRRD
jgi:acyl carrier protein